MDRKRVLFVADSLDNAYRFQRILAKVDADTTAVSSAVFKRAYSRDIDFDLVIVEIRAAMDVVANHIEAACASSKKTAVLFIVPEETLDTPHFPANITFDFVVSKASEAECAVRVNRLLWPGSDVGASELVVIGNMTINLATYQVIVGDAPLDLTYLEYALLAYLVTHPNRTYSRDTLLRHVWGFDYYGGSRTVDVHVRRVRAKLGPDLAQHLETVRGIGYLWSM